MTLGAATWLQAAAALGAVLLLIWGAARMLRASPLGASAARAGRRLRVEETLAIDPRRRVHVLRCGGRGLLLLTGAAGETRLLGWLPDDAARGGTADAP